MRLVEEGPAWAECEHPEQWSCWTLQGVECEVAKWLYATVRMLKPRAIIDTGTFVGTSVVHMASACRDDGRGHVWSQDTDAEMVALARKNAGLNGVAEWCTIIKGGDVAMLCEEVGAPIDFAFIDAGTPFESTRADELRAIRPYLSGRAVVVAHDTSPAWGRTQVDAVEGYAMVHMPTPRGLTIMRVSA